MQQLGLFDVSEQDVPQTFEALAQEYIACMALAANEVEREAYKDLALRCGLVCPVNGIVRAIYLATKIAYRYRGDLRGQRAIYLQEFPRFLAVQQNDPHRLEIAMVLEDVFIDGHDGAFLYHGDPILIWRNKVWRGDEEALVMSHLASDSHQVVSSLDEVEYSGDWIVC